MIGNTIEYDYYDWKNQSTKAVAIKRIGMVVDAFTEITGSVSSKSDTWFGSVSGVTGETKSKRKYKVEYYSEHDSQKQTPFYDDIYDWQLQKIIAFAGNNNQSIPEEKFVKK